MKTKSISIKLFCLLIASLSVSSLSYGTEKGIKGKSEIPKVSFSAWKTGDYTDYEVKHYKNGKLEDSYILSRKMVNEIVYENEKRKILEIEIIRSGKTVVSYKIMLPGNIEETLNKNPFYITNYTPNFSYALKLKTRPAGFPWGEVDLMNLKDNSMISSYSMLKTMRENSDSNDKNQKDKNEGLNAPKSRQLNFRESAAGVLMEELEDKEKNKNRLTLEKFQKTIKKCKPVKKKILGKDFLCDCFDGEISIQNADGFNVNTEYKIYQTAKIPLTGVVNLEVILKKEKNISKVLMDLVGYGNKNQENTGTKRKKD